MESLAGIEDHPFDTVPVQNARVVGKGWAGCKDPNLPGVSGSALSCEFRNNSDALKAGLPIFYGRPGNPPTVGPDEQPVVGTERWVRTFGEICRVMDEVFRKRSRR